MKTLNDHVILYDDDCPLCDLYTRGFVAAGMLDNDGRTAYSTLPPHLRACVDQRRAVNEIALVNKKTGDVTYGVDSLVKILGHRFTLAKKLLRCKAVHGAAATLYSFISYNRKVIVPSATFEAPGSCTPAFHRGYRMAYILFACMVTSIIVSAYVPLLAPLVPAGGYAREFLINVGVIVFQGSVVWMLKPGRTLHYLGNIMTISLAGALALLPALLLYRLGVVQPWFYLGWLAVAVAMMFAEHVRRVRLLQISPLASAYWVVYRILVITLIFLK